MDEKPKTRQLEAWASEFGRECTDKNRVDVDRMDREMGEYCRSGRKSELFHP